MKKIRILAICILTLWMLTSCAGGGQPGKGPYEGVKVTDALGSTVYIRENARVVSCYASFASCWSLAGGRLVGVTDDALEEQRMELDESVQLVGSVKEINLERLAALSPDYVILSADLAAHLGLQDALTQMGIPHGYFRVDTFSDYKNLMTQFCAVTGRTDLYQTHVAEVETRIEAIRAKIPKNINQSVLLMRVYSTGMKAKTDDNLAGQILREFGLQNIADLNPSMLEELSVEQIVQDDPDFIFATTMGNEANALKYLEQNVETNAAWSGLQAVQQGRYLLLPKDLFHYKPNERWDESYAYLAEIIFPGIFKKEG